MRSREHGVALCPLRLILVGGPGPGGKATASAPKLGVDAFCQQLLIWQSEGGKVHMTFNGLLALAERQDVSLWSYSNQSATKETFSQALE